MNPPRNKQSLAGGTDHRYLGVSSPGVSGYRPLSALNLSHAAIARAAFDSAISHWMLVLKMTIPSVKTGIAAPKSATRLPGHEQRFFTTLTKNQIGQTRTENR